MTKYLVVVESPAKARTINKFLGQNYLVKASNGHVRDLPKRDLGVDVENNFQPTYVVLRDSSKAIKALKEAARNADHILLASDPDREGEAIGWHVAEILKPAKKPVERIVFNEITKRSVLEAAKHPRTIDANLVNAQQARRVLDRLVGYKLSPLLNWLVRRGLSAGRVQSVGVRMICDREAEIRAFVPQEYWTLDVDLATRAGGFFTARLSRIRGEKAEVPNKEAMDCILGDLEGAGYRVAGIDRKEVKRRPSPPFITSTLQQEASRRLQFSPRKTMRIAQHLYEGVALGAEGSVGLITYMRTDSTRLAREALDDVRAYISGHFEPAMLPEKPNFYKSKKGAQEAHEAIRPTAAARTPESVKEYLDRDQLRLYTLIWQRFVACQMAPAVFDQTTIDVEAKDYVFRATEQVMKFPGFIKLYEESRDEDAEANGENALPKVAEGEELDARELRPEQHFTKPPPRYTEATLIRALEENGIGRPSTYAPIMNTIVSERGYAQRVNGRLEPTELGERVNALLVREFPDILDISFTAQLEERLDEVAEGNREWHALLRDFYDSFAKDLHQAKHRMVKEIAGDDAKCPKCGGELEVCEGRFGLFLRCVNYPDCDGRVSIRKTQAEPTNEVCEKCGAPMVIRTGRFGRFMACSRYPECKNTYNIDENGNKIPAQPREEPVKTDLKCPKCGSPLVIRRSRTGEQFYGCEAYPKCRYTRPMELGLKCPRPGCDGNLVRKRVKGRRFIGCDRYPDCDFMVFGEIDKDTPCPRCGNPWTVVKKRRNKPSVRECPVPGCGYSEEIEEPEE